jgi:hypothetical protein
MNRELDKLLLLSAKHDERAVPPGFDRDVVMQRRAELYWQGYAEGNVQPGDDKPVASAVLTSLTSRGEKYLAELLREEHQST